MYSYIFIYILLFIHCFDVCLLQLCHNEIRGKGKGTKSIVRHARIRSLEQMIVKSRHRCKNDSKSLLLNKDELENWAQYRMKKSDPPCAF